MSRFPFLSSAIEDIDVDREVQAVLRSSLEDEADIPVVELTGWPDFFDEVLGG